MASSRCERSHMSIRASAGVSGCHEPTHKSPNPDRQPLAMRRLPSRIEPEIGPIEP